MKFPRRKFLGLAAGAAALSVARPAAGAQSYPSRPVRIVVGFAAGGGSDIMARLVGQWLSERLGRQFIIENRPGAGSNVATEVVVNAPPDGYTLLLVNSSSAFNATLYGDLKFNFIRDITPIAGIHREPHIMEVTLSLPIKTVPEFISYAKANPGKINMASAGVGSGNHVAGELFKMMADVNLVHVPYRGGGPALVDLLGGQVQVMFGIISSSLGYLQGSKLRALAVTTATRSPVFPDVPTVAEYIPGYEASFWTGLGAPKNTPIEIVDMLNKEINAALADPTLQARLAELGGVPMPMTPAEFGKFIADETDKWAKVIRAAGIKVE